MAIQDLSDTTPSVSSIATGDILNLPYVATYKPLPLSPGVYKLECWGAQGGSRQGNGGRGGYSTGLLTLAESTNLYLYPGGRPAGYTGGFNGGGDAAGTLGSGGGGASDIRINSTSLYARVIVAGGAPGGFQNYFGGYGGGDIGGQGGSMGTGNQYAGSPGTQTSGGIGHSTQSITNGTFGKGGSGATTQSTSSTTYCVSGGGGGWYGGSGGQYAYASGCGGSGYVYSSTTYTNYPTGCLLTSAYRLTNTQTLSGNVSFIDPVSGTTSIGRIGHGYIRITVIQNSNKIVKAYTKINNTIRDVSGIYTKVNGQWKECSRLFVKVNGLWKESG